MNKESPTADAPVPPVGTEQAVDQAIKRQPSEEQSGVMNRVTSAVDGVTDVAGIGADIRSILD